CVEAMDVNTIEIICGFIQYYRETANYLERSWEWIERVGIVHIREILFDLEFLQQLLMRLEEDLTFRKNLVVKSPK
ncbi:MAG: hypothetical protein ACJ8GL_02915, partial [Bacillus sp. (in: firmicutes)]